MKKRKRRSRSRSLSRYDSFSDLAGLDEVSTPQNIASWGAIGSGAVMSALGVRHTFNAIDSMFATNPEHTVDGAFLETMAGLATATAGTLANKNPAIAKYGRTMMYGLVANTAIYLTGGFKPNGWFYNLLTGGSKK